MITITIIIIIIVIIIIITISSITIITIIAITIINTIVIIIVITKRTFTKKSNDNDRTSWSNLIRAWTSQKTVIVELTYCIVLYTKAFFFSSSICT